MKNRINVTGLDVSEDSLDQTNYPDIVKFTKMRVGKKTTEAIGVRITKLLVPKFLGYPGRIIGRGISIAPTNSELADALFRAMVELRSEDGEQVKSELNSPQNPERF